MYPCVGAYFSTESSLCGAGGKRASKPACALPNLGARYPFPEIHVPFLHFAALLAPRKRERGKIKRYKESFWRPAERTVQLCSRLCANFQFLCRKHGNTKNSGDKFLKTLERIPRHGAKRATKTHPHGGRILTCTKSKEACVYSWNGAAGRTARCANSL